MSRTFNLGGSPPLSFIAGAAIAQYRAVKLDTSGPNKAVACNAINDDTIGLSMHSASANDFITVQGGGKGKATAGAAIATGQQLMVQAGGSGKVGPAVGSTAKSIGVALHSVSNDGEIVEVQLGGVTTNRTPNT